jgi:hypothetical protein
VVTWSVDGVPTIMEKIIPHFDRYPLQSGKLQDYLVFREIVLRMRAKEHRRRDGFLELARLAFRMNATGKQHQYTLAMIESGILRGHTPDLFDREEDMVRPAWRYAERGKTEMTTPRLERIE